MGGTGSLTVTVGGASSSTPGTGLIATSIRCTNGYGTLDDERLEFGDGRVGGWLLINLTWMRVERLGCWFPLPFTFADTCGMDCGKGTDATDRDRTTEGECVLEGCCTWCSCCTCVWYVRCAPCVSTVAMAAPRSVGAGMPVRSGAE